MKNQEEIENLTALYNEGNYKELKEQAIRLLKSNENNYEALNALAIAYKHLGESGNAKETFLKLVNSGLKSDYIYSNAGNFFYDIGNINTAVQCHKHAIKLNPKNLNSLNQIGMALSNMGNDKEAIDYYKRALDIDNKLEGAHHNIANSYRNLKDYSEASAHYEESKLNLSKCQQLECLYHLNEKENFYKKLKIQSEFYSPHPLAACLSAHAAVRYDMDDNYSFCKTPFKFIQKLNLYDKSDFDDSYIEDFFRCFNDQNIDKKEQSLLKNGYQSSGNIFLIQEEPIQRIKNIILDKIESYKRLYKSTGATVISKWPKNYTLYGWLIVMNKGGNLGGHMHKEGWLSGSIYLARPIKQEKEDGDIIFSLHGSNYPQEGKSFPSKVLEIEKGDMVLFPSSIFHATLPFDADEKRITLAFDIIPNSEKAILN